jgi:hypothetical protein
MAILKRHRDRLRFAAKHSIRVRAVEQTDTGKQLLPD